ncbi:MAG: hypothetical protein AAFZ11_10770 [Pseudomonadota bacterium]
MLFSVVAAIASNTLSCTPVDGASRLFRDDVTWIIVGEIHGTNQTPQAFGNLVCLATRTNRAVIVAVEFSSDWQPAIDRFLASDGGAEAQREFLELPGWRDEFQDGRTSIAMLRLFEELRRMKQAGAVDGVVATDIGRTTPEGLHRDAAMAQAWQDISREDNAIVLALVGNIHAMRIPWSHSYGTLETAGSLMPSAQTVTVNVLSNGGEAWNCTREGCGVSRSGSKREAQPGLEFSNDPNSRWSVTYELGVPTTAALPAVQEFAATGQ